MNGISNNCVKFLFVSVAIGLAPVGKAGGQAEQQCQKDSVLFGGLQRGKDSLLCRLPFLEEPGFQTRAEVGFGSIDLLKQGADPNALIGGIGVKSYAIRPLHAAVLNENSLLLHILLDHGADPLARDERGQTAYELAQNSLQDNCRSCGICRLSLEDRRHLQTICFLLKEYGNGRSVVGL